MSAPASGAGADRRFGGYDRRHPTAAAPRPQLVPPIERHDPIAHDKLVTFEVAPVHRLIGTWQGPGTIFEFSRRARR
jgi:hypothetical protein